MDGTAPGSGRPTRALVVRWFGPVAEPESWHAAAYLGAGVPTTFAAFLVVGFLVVGIALVSWTVVGLALVIPGAEIVGWWSTAERRRARLVGVTIAPRALATGRGPVGAVRARLRDGARWRQVAYHLTAVFVAWALALAGVALWAAALYLVSLLLWGWLVGLSLVACVALAGVGVALTGLAARVVVGCAHLAVGYSAWLLGPDRYALMQSQVEHLTADRHQIIDAVASERRRIERNLHDGVQARLVALGIELGRAEQMLSERPEEARALLSSAREMNRASIAELREIGRGLHPAILDDRGIDAALSALVAASPIPIRLRCALSVTPSPAVGEAAYFIVSEAVGNVLKHALARSASVDVESDPTTLRIVVTDDGVGGAGGTRGTGLDGIDARVRALDGTMHLTSPPGGPTELSVELPMASTAREVLR